MAKNLDAILSKELINKRLIKKESLEAIMKKIAVSGETLAAFLVRQGMVREEEVLGIFAKKLKIPLINLQESSIEKSVIDKVPLKFATYYKFMP